MVGPLAKSGTVLSSVFNDSMLSGSQKMSFCNMFEVLFMAGNHLTDGHLLRNCSSNGSRTPQGTIYGLGSIRHACMGRSHPVECLSWSANCGFLAANLKTYSGP